MAEEKEIVLAEKPVVIPRQIAKLPVLKKNKVTARQLASYERDMALAYAPQLLPMALSALLDKVRQRDMRAIEKTLQIYNILHDGSTNGVNITNNIVNTATAVAASQAVRGFDSVVRELSQQESPE